MTIPIETASELTNNGVKHALEKTHSLKATNGSGLAPLDASSVRVTQNPIPKAVPAPNGAERFSMMYGTDHMLTCSWTASHGWHQAEIVPYGPLSLMPSASCLHYATECFEGMKLYRGYDGALRLFRPELNSKRMVMSATRVALPGFDDTEFLKLVAKLCAHEGPKWLPKDQPGSFLYVRPTMIGNDPRLGVGTPQEALLYVIIHCFPSINGFKHPVTGESRGMRLLASKDDMCRAWPGGHGYAKIGANYAPGLAAQGEAREMGFDAVLWLFGNDYQITEGGTSNVFVVWRTREGVSQLVTAPLDGQIILDGVTRRSVLELSRQRLAAGWTEGGLDSLEVVERNFTMLEVEAAVREGRMIEAFAVGTAYFVAPVECISWRGDDLCMPTEMLDGVRTGKYTSLLKGWLQGIMYGKERHSWGYVLEEA